MPLAKATSRKLLRSVLLLLSCCLLSPAWAHEGHDEEAEKTAVVSAELPRLVHSSPRLEAVALIDPRGLAIWVDDCASNRPLQGLDVSVRVASGALQARETEPGLYRLPLDLLGEDTVSLAITLRGVADGVVFEESFSGALPIPQAENGHPQGQAIIWIGGGSLIVVLILSLVLRLRARRRGIAAPRD